MYFVEELAEEGELQLLLVSKQHFQPEEAATILRQVVDAIESLHRRGVVHRGNFPLEFS